MTGVVAVEQVWHDGRSPARGLIAGRPRCMVISVMYGGYSKREVIVDLDEAGEHSAWRVKRLLLRAALKYGFTQQDGERVHKQIRAWAHEDKAKLWHQAMDSEVADWCSFAISLECRGLSCVDNVRAANKRKSSQVRRYKRQRANGCCGFKDWQQTCPVDWNVYLLGFNYGH